MTMYSSLRISLGRSFASFVAPRLSLTKCISVDTRGETAAHTILCHPINELNMKRTSLFSVSLGLFDTLYAGYATHLIATHDHVIK